MHGRVKVRTTAEQEAIKKVERAKKLAKYKAAITLVFEKRKNQLWDDELFVVTEKMLLENPEVYTVWNIRREALSSDSWNEDQFQEYLQKELILIVNCLRGSPKSYSTWHQRRWVVDRLANVDWKRELDLCAKCLDLDERNFHCWDYRRYVVKKAGISDKEEFDFSTSKILNNFSNYSSWHYRSSILSQMHPDKTGMLPIEAEKHKEELDLVMNATFTDPNDTSAWFYQRWLLNTRKNSNESLLWKAALDSSMVILVFHKEVPRTFRLFLNDEEIEVQWNPCVAEQKFAKVWYGTVSDKELESSSRVEIWYEDEKFQLEWCEDSFSYDSHSGLEGTEECDSEQLKEQLENYKQLAEMEPENKWALLTEIYLTKNIDFVAYKDFILENLETLCKIDPLRFNYYRDLRSRCLIEYKLHSMNRTTEDSVCRKEIDLSGMDLTAFYEEQYFALFRSINLGANRLGNRLGKFSSFQCCEKLSLSSNEISSVKDFPSLTKLEYLSLRNNEISSSSEIESLIRRCSNLRKIDLRDNPISDDVNIGELSRSFPEIELCLN